MARRGGPRDSPVARQILLLQVLVVVVLVVSAVALAAVDARRDVREDSRGQALAVAESMADSPTVRAAVLGSDPSATLQPYAEEVRADTDTDFVVVMDLDRTRFTHPDPDRIGEAFIGDLGTAPGGRPFTQEYAGTLGPSVRAVVPVMADDGNERVVALVSVGITLDRIQQQLLEDLPSIGLAALGALVVGLAGAWLISRRLRRQTHGMGEREITRMYEYYRAVLHAVREGLVLLDEQGRVQLVNDEARRLLGLPDDVVGRRFDDLGLPPAMVEAARGRVAESDHLYVLRDQVLVISSAPAYWGGAEVGAVVTVRDRTELQSVTGELDLVRGLTASLRAQNHEAANRLHTVVGLIELGRHEEAVDFATEELAVAQALADEVVGAVEEPALAALLLGKTAQAAEQGIELRLAGSVGADVAVSSRELVTVVGNLLDNAFDAVAESDRRQVRLRLEDHGAGLLLAVDDSGPGVPPQDAERVLERGWSTKAVEGRGLGLALVGQVARRHGGTIAVDSSDLGGARFTVTLGAASGSSSDVPSGSPAASS
ncbi:sensor histidine kinase [Nocardioides aurantiacus]|uniref:sensor histidine kinase n=1 Tax=Nocardioides aurantiacus TaxID=86796 RepID=UPI00403F3049